ncbi:NfeD family protein [Neptunicella marina]|uniref:NfeD family protein n=1 Tax=Neptunicella marina TaxID=2125989 RepID=A0A8J6M1I2_9ALTE|nr:NfeD family protein [Neptunicella marina]MBC3767694.1 NfeD family protein [Neptunicella marina]
MDFFSQHLPESLIALGIILVAIEVGILGFATLFLIFIGGASLLTGLAMKAEWIEVTINNALIFTGLLSVMLAIIAWQPMKKLQSQSSKQGQTSDFVGMCFELTSELSSTQLSSYRFSGILWTVKPGEKLDGPLAPGTQVTVTAVEVGTLYVAPVQDNPS